MEKMKSKQNWLIRIWLRKKFATLLIIVLNLKRLCEKNSNGMANVIKKFTCKTTQENESRSKTSK